MRAGCAAEDGSQELPSRLPKWRDGFASRTKIGPYPNVQLVAATWEPTSAAPSERKNIQDSETCYR